MKGSFADYMRLTFFCGKYCGLMPFKGQGQSEDVYRFTWKSGWAIYWIISLFIQLYMLIFLLYGYFKSGYDIIRMSAVLMIVIHFLLSLLVLKFCQRLQTLFSDVQALENLLPPIKKPQAAVKYVNRYMAAIFFFGTVEHVMYTIYSISMTHVCFKLPDDSGLLVKSFLMLVNYWYYEHFEFSYIPGVIFQIIRIQAGIMWVYGNMIIMAACIYLIDRFENFNHLILDKKNMFTKTFKPSWSELQIQYTRLSKLVAIIEKNINAIVFVSYPSNLYYVCLQMYFILNKLTLRYVPISNNCGEEHRYDFVPVLYKVYTMVSFVIRITLMSHLAAEVHVSSRLSLKVLHTVPSSEFDGDMTRLITQVYYSKIAISGLNFFKITREMLLSMVAKLLTYELVLAQF